MSPFINALPILSTLLYFFGMLVINIRPNAVWVTATLLLLWTILSIFLLTGRTLRSVSFWALLTSPLLLYLSTVSLVLLVTSPLIRWAVSLGVPFVLGFYENQVLRYHFHPSKYQPFALENLAGGVGSLIVFFSSSALYGSILFLGFGWDILLPIWLVMIAALMLHVVWVKKVLDVRGWRWCAAMIIMLTQVFIATHFLPTSFIINGAIVTVFFYCFMSLHRSVMREKIERRFVLRPVFISLLLIILILSTASWT